MYKKLIISILILSMLVAPALARVEPIYVKEIQGIAPATYLAGIVAVAAMVNNIGRYIDKKRADPNMVYNYAYFNTSMLVILTMCMGVLQTPVVELSPIAILGAIIMGFGGNEAATRITKI